MIAGLDHLALGVLDLDAGLGAYETLFGRPPAWRARADGVETAVFALANTALELMAPAGAGGERLQLALAEEGEGLKSLAFATADIAGLRRRWENVGLDPEPIGAGGSRDLATGKERSWRRTRAGKAQSHGVRLFALEPDSRFPAPAADPAMVSALDHIVIRTPNPERALALYGAKLGLDLRMDRTNPDWGARLMFFRCGGLILEVAHALAEGVCDGPDQLWGCTWRVGDAAAAHARLTAAGLALSPLRAGRKPGTTVFSVKSGTCAVPTLLLEPSP